VRSSIAFAVIVALVAIAFYVLDKHEKVAALPLTGEASVDDDSQSNPSASETGADTNIVRGEPWRETEPARPAEPTARSTGLQKNGRFAAAFLVTDERGTPVQGARVVVQSTEPTQIADRRDMRPFLLPVVQQGATKSDGTAILEFDSRQPCRVLAEQGGRRGIRPLSVFSLSQTEPVVVVIAQGREVRVECRDAEGTPVVDALAYLANSPAYSDAHGWTDLAGDARFFVGSYDGPTATGPVGTVCVAGPRGPVTSEPAPWATSGPTTFRVVLDLAAALRITVEESEPPARSRLMSWRALDTNGLVVAAGQKMFLGSSLRIGSLPSPCVVDLALQDGDTWPAFKRASISSGGTTTDVTMAPASPSAVLKCRLVDQDRAALSHRESTIALESDGSASRTTYDAAVFHDGGVRFRRVRTDGDGVLMLAVPADESGRFKVLPSEIQRRLNGVSSHAEAPYTTSGAGSISDLGDIVLPFRLHASGRVVDETGAPVPRASVFLTAAMGDAPPSIGSATAIIGERVDTDSEGRFKLFASPVNDELWIIATRGDVEWASPLRVAAGAEDLLLTIRSQSKITGVVLLNDEVMAGAEVGLRPIRTRGPSSHIRRIPRVAPRDRRFEFSSVPPGEYLVDVLVHDRSFGAEVEIRVPPDRPDDRLTDLQVGRFGPLEERKVVVLVDGRPYEKAFVSARPGRGGDAVTRPTDKAGVVRFAAYPGEELELTALIGKPPRAATKSSAASVTLTASK
jgi:hypothetical protein